MRRIDLKSLALDTFYHAGNLGQESEAQYERAIGFKAGDNVERSGVPGAIYKVLKINDNGSATIRMFLDAENWDGPTTVVSYDNVRAGKLRKTDKVPRRRAKDAVVEKYRGYEIEEGETGAVRVVGLGRRYAQYFKGWSRASAVEAAKRAIDRELAKPEPLPVKPEDIIRSMYTDRKAKDQVPQDCFDAQILGV
jgi:hypothetical protein